MPKELENEVNQGFDESFRMHIFSKAPEIVEDIPLGLGPFAYRFTSNMYLNRGQATNKYAHHSENCFVRNSP